MWRWPCINLNIYAYHTTIARQWWYDNDNDTSTYNYHHHSTIWRYSEVDIAERALFVSLSTASHGHPSSSPLPGFSSHQGDGSICYELVDTSSNSSYEGCAIQPFGQLTTLGGAPIFLYHISPPKGWWWCGRGAAMAQIWCYWNQ